jgi:hypothetical protein
MTVRDPQTFRPMADLAHERPVEFLLPQGRIVTGWLMIGIVSPSSRSFFQRDPETGTVEMSKPTAWRDFPVPPATLVPGRILEGAAP